MSIANEQMEELRSKLCGISENAHRLHRKISGMQELERRFRGDEESIHRSLSASMTQLVIDIDAFALNAYQFEEHTKSIWSLPTTAAKLPVVPAKLRVAARKLRAS
jgi:hypothetical protein